jgi:hypothetical protein
MRGLALIGEQSVEDFSVHAAFRGLGGDAIAEALKLRRIQVPQALVLLGGKQNGNVAIMAAYHHRLALRRIQERS